MVKFRKNLISFVLAGFLGGCGVPPYIDNFNSYFTLEDRNKIKEERRKDVENLILERAKENQILMFGENHNSSMCHFFVKKLLEDLNKSSYGYFAIERDKRLENKFKRYFRNEVTETGLWCDIFSEPDYRKRPVENKDPLLLKEAFRLGYEIVFYDDLNFPISGSCERDIKGFENLQERIFKTDKNAKVIIFCGGLHINRGEDLIRSDYSYILGQLLDEFTNRKVYTIDLETGEYPDEIINPDLRICLNDFRFQEYPKR